MTSIAMVLSLWVASNPAFTQENRTGVPIVILMQGSYEFGVENSANLAETTFIGMGIPRSSILKIGPFNFSDATRKAANKEVAAASKLVFEEVEKRVKETKDREVIIYFVGHGDSDFISFTENQKHPDFEKGSTYYFSDLAVTISDYLPKQKVTLIVDSCGSGGAINACKAAVHTVITGADSNRTVRYLPMDGRGFEYYYYWVFSYHFFSAIRGHYPNGDPIKADQNLDGKVSFEEAFAFAQKKPNLGVEGPNGVVPLIWWKYGRQDPSNPQYYSKKPAPLPQT